MTGPADIGDGFVDLSALAPGPMPLGRALSLSAKLVRALEEVHGSGHLHRGVDADHIRIHEASGELRLLESSRTTPLPAGGVLPAPDYLDGDARFVAPECTGRMSRPIDTRADLYSAGVAMYRLLTGRFPFEGDDSAELVHAALARSPVSPSKRDAGIPAPVSTVVLTLLAKDPEDRYRSAAGLRVDLEALGEGWYQERDLYGLELGRADAAPLFEVSRRIVGREKETAALLNALDRCSWGSTQLVIVKGPPGVGKSVLVDEVQRASRSQGAFIAGKYDQFRRTVPYSAIAEAFEGLIHRLLAEPDHVLADWRERVLGALGPNAQLVIDLIPDLEHITGPQPGATELAPAEARNRFDRVFRDLVDVFARPDHPLTFFLDDLQWADTASLKLVEVLLTDPHSGYLLIFGSYRDTEVGPAHPVSLLLASLRDEGVVPEEITLSPLSPAETCDFVSASLDQSLEACQELASLLHDRTGGNPFFLVQFLRVLHDRGLISGDDATGAWQWSVQRIEGESFTREVTEFVVGRLTAVPDETRDALVAAACLGASFATNMLAAALEETPEDVASRLAPAVRAGLIEPREQRGNAVHAFVHDRIQQAAFGLLSAPEVDAYRYRVGKLVLESFSAEQLDDHLFEVIENLNAGAELDLEPAERLTLARLDLTAGQRARAALAYDDAVRLLRTGIELLPADPWRTEYELTFGLHAECFECEYLSGDFDAAERRFRELEGEARDRLETAKIYYTRVLLESSRGRNAQAVEAGLIGLRKFGVRVPEHPRQWHVLWELAKTRLFLGFRTVEELEHLPTLRDPDLQAIARLLVIICPASYFHNPNIMTLAALKIVNMSLRKGAAPSTPFGYVLLALVLGAGLGRYRAADAFGSLSVKLAEAGEDVALEAKVVLIFGAFVELWTRPIDDSIERLKDGFRTSLDAGDHQYAGYCCLQVPIQSYFAGVPLPEVNDLATRYGAFIERTRDAFAVDSHRSFRQVIYALLGETESGWSLTTEGWEESAEVERIRASGNPTTLFYVETWKMQIRYMFGRIDDAWELAVATTRDYEAGYSQVCQFEQTFYSGLTAVARRRSGAVTGRRERKILRTARRRLRTWGQTSPRNYRAPHLLLEAEVASLADTGEKTMTLFDGAIEEARRHGFLNLEALANERAAAFHEAAGRRRVAEAYAAEAVQTYRKWGAVAMVAHLESRTDLAPERHSDARGISESSLGRDGGARASDVDAAIKAAHAIAGEFDLAKLLERLVEVTLEAAGAQRCVLVLDEGERGLLIQAAGSVSNEAVEILSARPLDGQPDVGAAIVRYAARTLEPVALDDARVDPRFAESPYVRLASPISVLARPIIRSGALVGVLYLENNLAAGSFTPARLKALEIIASELAIALENARLRQEQQNQTERLQETLRRVEMLQQAKAHLSKFVPKSVQKIVEDNPVAPDLDKQARDVSVLFLDIAGYTRMTSALDDSRIDYLLERYFSAFLEDIHANGGDINETAGDGLMILFLDGDPHEHAAQAARTALAIRSRAASINEDVVAPFEPVSINIGINSGEALVGSTKLEALAGTRYTYTATGGVTNLAARIGAAAKEGSILISDETARRIRADFVVEDAGAHDFKNIADAVQVFRLIDGPATPTKDGS